MALTLWPRFALLTAMSTLLILLGAVAVFPAGAVADGGAGVRRIPAGAARHACTGGDEGKFAPDRGISGESWCACCA